MPAYTLKRNDTYPPLVATLIDANGVINLTSAASVKFIMKGIATNTLVQNPCTIIDAVNGKVQYNWGASDAAVPDTYNMEFQITWGGGGKQTVPNAAAQNPQVLVDADLDNA